MNNSLPKAYSKAQSIRSEIDALMASPMSEISVRQRLQGLTVELESAINDLRICMQTDPSGGGSVWRVRLDLLTEGLARAQGITRQGPGGYEGRREEEKRVREELFGNFRNVENGATLRERGALLSSNAMMDDIISQGAGSLGNILSQNSLLKGTRTRINDLLNRSGLAHVLAKTISGREKGDGWLLFGCVILVVVLVFVIRWLR